MRSLARSVVERYAANVQIVETLARGYGFRPLFFWQPTIFDKAELTAFERDEAQKYAWTAPHFRWCTRGFASRVIYRPIRLFMT